MKICTYKPVRHYVFRRPPKYYSKYRPPYSILTPPPARTSAIFCYAQQGDDDYHVFLWPNVEYQAPDIEQPNHSHINILTAMTPYQLNCFKGKQF